jgi:hypothetical protein
MDVDVVLLLSIECLYACALLMGVAPERMTRLVVDVVCLGSLCGTSIFISYSFHLADEGN